MTTDRTLVTSSRNLVEGGGGTPLRKFWGVLKSIYPDTIQYGDRSSDVNTLNFADVEVIESTEPYNFPTATISIKLSNRKDSSWGVFSESVNVFLADDEDVADLVDKKMLMEMEVGHEFQGKDKITGEQFKGNPWKVLEVEGITAAGGEATDTSAVAKAKALLNGKTRAEFNKAALADTTIRNDVALQRAVTDKSFIKGMVDTGEFEEDGNGVFVLVPISDKVVSDGTPF